MSKKKPAFDPEVIDIQAEVKGLLNSEDPNLKLDFESFRKRIQPFIHRKTLEIKEERRRRNEAIQLGIGYGIVIILTPLIILDFRVNGWQGGSVGIILFMMIFSLLILGCCPLLVKFKKN